MAKKTSQMNEWSTDFGQEYTDRSAQSPEQIEKLRGAKVGVPYRQAAPGQVVLRLQRGLLGEVDPLPDKRLHRLETEGCFGGRVLLWPSAGSEAPSQAWDRQPRRLSMCSSHCLAATSLPPGLEEGSGHRHQRTVIDQLVNPLRGCPEDLGVFAVCRRARCSI